MIIKYKLFATGDVISSIHSNVSYEIFQDCSLYYLIRTTHSGDVFYKLYKNQKSYYYMNNGQNNKWNIR